MAELDMSSIRGLPVIIPDGRVLGTVHDTVLSAESGAWSCTHLFVSDPPASLVVAIPWNWVRSIGDVVILRWFPQTPIPKKP
jgi:sporulation protein YlmC with PRC-barrel domain